MQSRFDPKLLRADQIRAARALLGWSAQDLADKADLGVATVRRAEWSKGPLTINEANTRAIIRVIENAGVRFLASGEEGPGVRFANPLA